MAVDLNADAAAAAHDEIDGFRMEVECELRGSHRGRVLAAEPPAPRQRPAVLRHVLRRLVVAYPIRHRLRADVIGERVPVAQVGLGRRHLGRGRVDELSLRGSALAEQLPNQVLCPAVLALAEMLVPNVAALVD